MVGRNEHTDERQCDDGEIEVDEFENGAQSCDVIQECFILSDKRIHKQKKTQEESNTQFAKLCGAVKTILECVGEDVNREGLLNTPGRYAEALLFFTKGYREDIRSVVNDAVFSEDHGGLVLVRDIEIFSLCEHHLVPFTGKMHIGYIPDGRVIGLSKLARIADVLARRLQIQERLTEQVARAVFDTVQPRGVAVVVESGHLCMVMRGVQKLGATTVTSSMLGSMRTDAEKRREFFDLVGMK